MAILAINTASSETAIALINDDKTEIIIEKSWKSQNNEAEFLMPEIQKCLKSSLLDWKDLSQVLVIKGPGSFTGLRIGVVVANTLKYLLNIKLSSINTFEYLWSAYEKQEDTPNTALLIFAGQRGVYLSKSPNDISEKEVSILPIEDIPSSLAEINVQNIYGDISEDQKAQLKNFTHIELKNSFAENVLNILQNKSFENETTIYPVYVKAPAITKSKNKIFN